MAKNTDYQDSNNINPKYIAKIIREALRQKGYDSINSICDDSYLLRYTAERALLSLENAQPNDDKRIVQLHTLQLICERLGIDFVISKLIETDSNKEELIEWTLNLDNFIDLRLLRIIQPDFFTRKGKPKKVKKSTRNKIPKHTILSKTNLSLKVYISAKNWNKFLDNHEVPGRDTKMMGLKKFQLILSDLGFQLKVEIKDNSQPEAKPQQAATSTPKPDEMVLIGRYHSDLQYRIATENHHVYFIRIGNDKKGRPYVEPGNLKLSPKYIIIVPSNGIVKANPIQLKYNIFEHDGQMKPAKKEELKEFGYYSRSSATDYMLYGLKHVAEDIQITDIDLLLDFLGKDQRPRFVPLSKLLEKNLLEKIDDQKPQSLVAQED